MNQALDLTILLLLKFPKYEETVRAVNKARFLRATSKPTPESLNILGTGRAGEEAMAAFCAFIFRNTNFEQRLLLSVNHSGDTDTVGAITSNVLDLLLGERSIPLKCWST